MSLWFSIFLENALVNQTETLPKETGEAWVKKHQALILDQARVLGEAMVLSEILVLLINPILAHLEPEHLRV